LQRWRRPLGIILALVTVAVAGFAWLITTIGAPFQSAASISPDRKWRAWLERPNWSMEPMYYTLKVRRESLFATPTCDVASVSNWFAERYTRLSWPANNALRLDYGLSGRDTTGEGRPRFLDPSRECAGLVVQARRDRSLDALATRENDTNNNYARPVEDRSPF